MACNLYKIVNPRFCCPCVASVRPPPAVRPGAKYTRPSISLDMALQSSPKGPPPSSQGVISNKRAPKEHAKVQSLVFRAGNL